MNNNDSQTVDVLAVLRCMLGQVAPDVTPEALREYADTFAAVAELIEAAQPLALWLDPSPCREHLRAALARCGAAL
jgi:hypothetical protein